MGEMGREALGAMGREAEQGMGREAEQGMGREAGEEEGGSREGMGREAGEAQRGWRRAAVTSEQSRCPYGTYPLTAYSRQGAHLLSGVA